MMVQVGWRVGVERVSSSAGLEQQQQQQQQQRVDQKATDELPLQGVQGRHRHRHKHCIRNDKTHVRVTLVYREVQ